jgi:hypothetical protein
MGVKKFGKWGAGIVMGTVQQLGNDSGPIADRLNGFRGRDFAMGPIVTYDTKLGGKAPLSSPCDGCRPSPARTVWTARRR